ncbi:hypothetical protein LCI18_005568 [Fusarium solani-melongenae]|uniref:Uncharacterized protein n=1 Tax=Fusarium solani subsp. cucurbitae TaxID=2747967 RepID=A0ACD3Z0M5_FUSSC|nr:hypothetical protein LCI18_005568 [Fusarium solani-melongenae]
MFCASCGQEGHGRFCSNCGTGLDKNIPLLASAGSVHWTQQTNYEALMEYPEVKHKLAHQVMRDKRLTEDELLRYAPKAVTTIYSYDQSFSAMLNMKTGKSDARTLAKPCGSIIVAAMCYLTWARFEVTTVRQGTDLVALSCKITSDALAPEGELNIVISKVEEELTRIEVKTHFPGIIIDWGRSKRILKKVFAFCEEARVE